MPRSCRFFQAKRPALEGLRHCSSGHPVTNLGSPGLGEWQAASAKTAGLKSLLRLLALQEPSLAIRDRQRWTLLTSTSGSTADSYSSPHSSLTAPGTAACAQVRGNVPVSAALPPHIPDSLSFHAAMSEPVFLDRRLRDADIVALRLGRPGAAGSRQHQRLAQVPRPKMPPCGRSRPLCLQPRGRLWYRAGTSPGPGTHAAVRRSSSSSSSRIRTASLSSRSRSSRRRISSAFWGGHVTLSPGDLHMSAW